MEFKLDERPRSPILHSNDMSNNIFQKFNGFINFPISYEIL